MTPVLRLNGKPLTRQGLLNTTRKNKGYNKMTKEELEEIKRREREASPGPWSLYQYGNCTDVETAGGNVCEAVEGLDENVPANMEFIAQLRNSAPRLVSALEEAWAEIERLKGANQE